MNKQSSFESQQLRRSSRTYLWVLLVCSISWSVITFGCATVTFVTDVIYNENGNGAVVSLDTELNEGVFAALQEIDPKLTSSFASGQEESGWATKQGGGGRKLLSSYKFNTLADLKDVPRLIVGDSGEISDSFIQSISVVTKEINLDVVEYTFKAELLIAPPTEESGGGSGEESGEEGVVIDPLADYPKLKAAIAAAGPAVVVVQSYLPGTVDPKSVTLGGEVNGGRVRWRFSEDAPGTYNLTAISYGLTPAGAQKEFTDMFDSSLRIQRFRELSTHPEWEGIGAMEIAAQSLSKLREKSGRAMDAEFTPKEALVFEAVYLGNICTTDGIKKSCLMPGMHRALPLIEKLAAQLGDDIDSMAALGELVEQLYDHDLANLSKR